MLSKPLGFARLRRPLAGGAMVSVLTGCLALAACDNRVGAPGEDSTRSEQDEVAAAATLSWVAVDSLPADAEFLGEALLCAATCAELAVPVTIIGIAGGIAYYAYRHVADRDRLPPSSARSFRMNLDWLTEGTSCPALSSNAVHWLSARYTRCIAARVQDSCKARIFDEAHVVSRCELAHGGVGCLSDAYFRGHPAVRDNLSALEPFLSAGGAAATAAKIASSLKARVAADPALQKQGGCALASVQRLPVGRTFTGGALFSGEFDVLAAALSASGRAYAGCAGDAFVSDYEFRSAANTLVPQNSWPGLTLGDAASYLLNGAWLAVALSHACSAPEVTLTSDTSKCH